MKLMKMKCENCGASLKVNANLEKITCNYCGEEILIDDEATKIKRVEEAKLKARKENHEQELKERNDLFEQELKEKKMKDEFNSVEKFKKGKSSKILLISFIFALLFFYSFDNFWIKCLAVIQAISFISAWLMGMKILKEPFWGAKTVIIIIGFALLVPMVNINDDSTRNSSKDYEKMKWKQVVLSELLPEINLDKVDVHTNNDKSLWMDVGGMTKSEFYDYIEECEEFGFEIDIDKSNNRFSAYDEDGNYIKLYYDESDKEISFNLDIAMLMKENQWPNSDIAELLPEPKSKKGNLDLETSKGFLYYAANTTESDFDEYIYEVKKAGFNLNSNKSGNYFKAENEDGYTVEITLKDFDIMLIDIDAPEEKEENKEKEKETEENKDKENNAVEENKKETEENTIRNDFKVAMDSYERFMDEYVSFMKKYTASNGTDLSLLSDYNTYMTKYIEMVESFEKWESENLNLAEEKYYLEVQTRVTQKLLEISY